MDLIDRDNLKEAIKMATTIPVDCLYDLGYNDMVLNAVKIVDSMPTIDAQPVKHGKWEWEPGYVGTTAKCSVCGLSPMGFYSLPIIQIGRLPEYPFCPNCGSYNGGDADETP